MMKTRKSVVITSLVLVTLIIATGVVFAQGMGAVNQGTNSIAQGDFSTVSGGRFNNAIGNFSTVSGGGGGDDLEGNFSSGEFSTIGGGAGNNAAGIGSTISGGRANDAGDFSTVGGGDMNVADSVGSTVGGGRANVASVGEFSTVGGGGSNNANGDFSTVGGGDANIADGLASTVGGGRANTAKGDFSFAAGNRAIANHNGTFVWADSTFGPQAHEDFNSTAANEFAVRATGGVRFVSQVDATGIPTAGVTLGPGGNSWMSISDRSAKENFASIDGRDILERLSNIPIETWNYKTQDPAIRHIGPMAQDFYTAFRVGEDNKHINTIDADGVALAAIQGLYEIVQEKDAQITVQQQQIVALQEEKDAEIAELQARMAALEKSLGAEAKEAQTGLFPFSPPAAWMITGGLGLLLVTPGLVLGYRRIKRDG